MSERDGAVRRRPLGAPIDGETKVGEKTTSSLSVLRRVRKRREEIATQAFQQCQQQVDAVHARIARLERALAQETAEMRRRLLEADASTSTSQYRLGVQEIRAAISRDRALLAGLTETLRRRREELLDAMSRRKTLDWLGDERDARRRLAARREALHRQDDVFASHAASRIDRQAR